MRYVMCRQTVTLYHKEGDTVTRTVIPRAYLDHKKVRNVEKTGSTDVTSFLLVYPAGPPGPCAGDKVVHGVGPEITAAGWPHFIPAKVPGLCVVKYVDPKYNRNKLAHWEAGG